MFKLKLRVNVSWSVVAVYVLVGGILSRSHPLASRICSGSRGGSKLAGRPHRPQTDSAAAKNQASNSLLANTTPNGTSLRTPVADFSSCGPTSAGQSSSASSMMKRPAGRRSIGMSFSSARCNSSCPAKMRERFTRNGGGTTACIVGSTCSTTRWMRVGTDSTSPCPSTTQPIQTGLTAAPLSPSPAETRRRLAGISAQFASVHRPYKAVFGAHRDWICQLARCASAHRRR
jgi:hypothetical protein